MIMALLIGLLLRGGKFLTLAARRTLWQMFENSVYGPKLMLDNDKLLKLARNNEAMVFGQDKDIQTNEEVLCIQKEYENIVRYASAGDNREVKPQPDEFQELKELERKVDGELKDLEKAMPQPQADANLDRILKELERKVQEVDANEPFFLPALPLDVPRKKSGGDNFSELHTTLDDCISKYKIDEHEINEPILHAKNREIRDNYLKTSISDDLYIKFGKSHKYFKRITEKFSTVAANSHNSLPNISMTTGGSLSFYSCRTLHTKTGNVSDSQSAVQNMMTTEGIENKISAVKKMLHDSSPISKPESKMELDDESIREMLDKKIKMLAEKKDRRRKKKKINKSEIKEREKLMEINQKVFNKVEDDIKSVKIIKKDAVQKHLVDVDELLALLDDNPKINFLRNMKVHKELPLYETATSTDFIVHMRPNFEQADSTSSLPLDTSELTEYMSKTEDDVFFKRVKPDNKLNMEKLQEEIVEKTVTSVTQKEGNVKVLVKFMAYEQIPRICHLNKENLENEIRTGFARLVTSFQRAKNTVQINRKWEVVNKIRLQEEVTTNSLLKKFALPSAGSNKDSLEVKTPAVKSAENVEIKNVCCEDNVAIKKSVSELPKPSSTVQEIKCEEKVSVEQKEVVPVVKSELNLKDTESSVIVNDNKEDKIKVTGSKLQLKCSVTAVQQEKSNEIELQVPKVTINVPAEKAVENVGITNEEVKEEKVETHEIRTKASEEALDTNNKAEAEAKSLLVAKGTVEPNEKAESVVEMKPIEEKLEVDKCEENKSEVKLDTPIQIKLSVKDLKISSVDDVKQNEDATLVQSKKQENSQAQNSEPLLVTASSQADQVVTKPEEPTKIEEKPITPAEEETEKKPPVDELEMKSTGNESNTETLETEIVMKPKALASKNSEKSLKSNKRCPTKLKPQKSRPHQTMQINIVSSKLEIGPQHTEASSNPIQVKPTVPVEKKPKRAPDFGKIRTGAIQNSLPETSQPSAAPKSRIPVRKSTAESSDAMEEANKTIQKIALQYKNQKAGRISTLIPSLNRGFKAKIRPLQRKSSGHSNKSAKSSKTSIKETEQRSCRTENVPQQKLSLDDNLKQSPGKSVSNLCIVTAPTEEKAVAQEEPKEEIKCVESESQVLKSILKKHSSHLEATGKNEADFGIESEMPPDFDVLAEVDVVDIPTDEDRLDVPAEMKHKVAHLSVLIFKCKLKL